MSASLQLKYNQISFEELDKFIKGLGFDLCGATFVEEFDDFVKDITNFYFENKFYAGMNWLVKNLDVRIEPKKRFPQANTIVVFAKRYPTQPLSTTDGGLISAYAKGKDYHNILAEKADKLCKYLLSRGAKFAKFYVDTGPVFEKYWAVKAGLGWIGKNSLLINKKFGSYLFLGVVLTDIHIPTIKIENSSLKRNNSNLHPLRTQFRFEILNYCGSCTKCINVCPTGAIVKDGVVDSNKCIAYLTVEHKGFIKSELQDKIGRWIFGCDICQIVCPWNSKIINYNVSEGDHQVLYLNGNLLSLLQITPEIFYKLFKNSPIKRVKWEGFIRNVIIVLANQKIKKAIPYIKKFLYSSSYTLQVTAFRALYKLNSV